MKVGSKGLDPELLLIAAQTMCQTGEKGSEAMQGVSLAVEMTEAQAAVRQATALFGRKGAEAGVKTDRRSLRRNLDVKAEMSVRTAL